jgi:uncharacterized membrane protein YagU involved in acid resistance
MGICWHRRARVHSGRQPGSRSNADECALSAWHDIHIQPRSRQIDRYFFPLSEGLIFSLLYVAVFQSLGRATWWLGGLFGFVQATFVLAVLLPVMPALHPRVANEQYGPTVERQLEPPGFMGLHYGIRTPISVLLAHTIFGIILGTFYVVK